MVFVVFILQYHDFLADRIILYMHNISKLELTCDPGYLVHVNEVFQRFEDRFKKCLSFYDVHL